MQVWEAVARINSAAAWNLAMNQAIAAYAAWLPAEGARELFRDGPPTVAGALNPPAAATRVDGGWRITGQVPFGSGCHNAQWLAMPAAEMEGGRPKVDPATGKPEVFGVFFPRTEAEILDTWHTLGMRGTGSTDFAVRDLFVPDRMTAPVGPLSRPAPGFEGPLFRMWPWTAILGEATVSVGIAAAAVDRAVELCRTKTAAYNATPIARAAAGAVPNGQGQGPGRGVARHAPPRRERRVRRGGAERHRPLVRRQNPLAARGLLRRRSLRRSRRGS